MFPSTIIGAVAVAGAAVSVAAQETTSSATPAVPTGEPIPGDYTGALRPQIHFSPPQHFMNDPNGMFRDANGTWHLYYQYNPTGLVAGNQHWGHATSADLYHWENQAIALYPPEEGVYVFSGSAVVDVNNTSGFFPDQDNGVVAVFTLAHGASGPQTQDIAYSRDGGYTFEYYAGNPVIDSASSQFRDPKVIWYEDHWVAVIAYSQEFVVGIYTSPDLKAWTWASNFTRHGLLGTQYECPNLVKMPVRERGGGSGGAPLGDDMYVLSISVQPGAPLGGSITEYFPGDFNGTHFVAVDGATRLTDFAKDNYAAQYFYGTAEGANPVSLGWASNWQYAQQVPTGEREGWRSAMTLPRENYLTYAPRVGLVMASAIYDLAPVLAADAAPLAAQTLGNGSSVVVDYGGVASGAVLVEVDVTGINTTLVTAYTTVNLTLSSPASGEALQSGFYFSGDTPFFVNRGLIRGFDNIFFTDKFSTADVYSADPSVLASWRLQAVVDRSIFEVLVDGGLHAGTVLFYPTQPLSLLTVAARDLPEGAQVSVSVRALKSAWAAYEDESGIVAGNVTGTANSTAKRHMAYEASF
ncbi:glycosyl hydrolase [Biscogniauxia sp. FL1348]|nr:glycosyl hydrolase [Biscogniauxia sp. FL1348]